MQSSAVRTASSTIALLLFLLVWAAVIAAGVLVLVNVLHTLVSTGCGLPYWWAACW